MFTGLNVIINVHTLKNICLKTINERALQLACFEPVHSNPSLFKMETETDLHEVDNFPDRAGRINSTHCQQTTNARPMLIPDEMARRLVQDSH